MDLVRKSRISAKLFSGIDATAFASILVVLVFTVWVFQGMSYHPHHGISADLPKVLHPVAMRGALREDAMKVTILRDGKAYFGNEQINSADLPTKIQDRLKDREVERKVYIVADMRARWGGVKLALDGVRSAGIVRVAFLADQGPLPQLSR
jgi:biopolymer transport protein ExbD